MNIGEEHLTKVRTKRRTTNRNRPGDGLVQQDGKQQWTDAAGLPLLPDEQPISTVRDSLYERIPLGLAKRN